MLFPARILSYLHALSFMFWVWMRSKIYTLLTPSLDLYLPSVRFREALMTSICIKVFFSNKTKFAFRSPLFASCFYKRHMVVVSWDTLESPRPRQCYQRTTIGPRWCETYQDSSSGVQHVYKLSQLLTLMVFILHYLFHKHLGPTLAWTSF